VGVLAVAVAVVVLTGRSGHDTGPPKPTEPSPSPSMFTLPADPFLTDRDLAANFPEGRFARETNAGPHQLSPCLTDPRGWGAAEAKVATYVSRIDPTATLNEFVLRFTDPVSAHRAILGAWAGLNNCRQPASAPIPQPSANFNPINAGLDEELVDKRAHRDRHDGLYELFIGRKGMVVVVIEDTAFPRDEAGSPHHFLDPTLARAIPGLVSGLAPACVEHPQPCSPQFSPDSAG
jgi:hypothetical protein